MTNDYHKRLSKGGSGLESCKICIRQLLVREMIGYVSRTMICRSSMTLADIKLFLAGWIHAERFINKALAHLVYGPKTAAKSLQQALSSQLFKLFSPSLPSKQAVQEEEDLLLLLHQCPFLNVSVCEASLKYSLKEEAFLVVVYNPLAWPTKAPVQVPMDYSNKAAWAVKGVLFFLEIGASFSESPRS